MSNKPKKGTRDIYRQQALQALEMFESGVTQSEIARQIGTYRERVRAMVNNARRYRMQMQEPAE